MPSKDEGPFGLGLWLAGLAGWVDAVGATQTGGVFLSFMSGNTTDLATSAVSADWQTAGFIAAVIGLFVSGVAVGELVEELAGRWGRCAVLALETVCLAGGTAGAVAPPAGFDQAALAFPLVVAMGLQTTVMKRAGPINIGLTYVTGTLVQLGRSLAAGSFRVAGLYAAVWLALGLGAAMGALARSYSTPAALTAAALAAAATTLIHAAA